MDKVRTCRAITSNLSVHQYINKIQHSLNIKSINKRSKCRDVQIIMLCVGRYRTKPYISLSASIFQRDFERTMLAVGLVDSPVEVGHNDI